MYAAVLAGGSGTRFWPLSRRATPKQFLELGRGSASLLEATVTRLAPDIDAAKLLVVCGRRHADEVRARLPDLDPAHVVAEPAARNTAAAVALATAWVRAHEPEAVLAVLPADHHVGDGAAFRRALAAAAEAAAHGRIVTLGVRPTRPETGYGYIRLGPRLSEAAGHAVHEVAAFVEKPDAERAERYVASGDHLWNAGIFVFRADVMHEQLARHVPGVAGPLDGVDVGDPDALDAVWDRVETTSLDYGVMERTDRAAVLPVDFDWSDVGSFAALAEIEKPDPDGNVLLGDIVAVDTKDALVHARTGRVVALVGASDLVVVDTPGALLICARDRAQDVREIVRRLEEAGRDDVL